MASNDTPKSGKGSDMERLSQSPQSPRSLRRGGADPTDISEGEVQLGFSERHDYENTMKPSPPIEGTASGES
jgi:hypothetical protein